MASYGKHLLNLRSPNYNSLISSASHGEIEPRYACGAKTATHSEEERTKFWEYFLGLQKLYGKLIVIVFYVLFDNVNC